MKVEKVKKNAEDYLQWAGFFSQEPEIVARQPGWWQRERKFIREALDAGRSFTLDEMLAIHMAEKQVRIARHVPATMSLAALKSRFHTSGDVGLILSQLQQLVTTDEVIRFCTAFGDGRQLLRQRPGQGLYAYLWTLALYQRKILPSIPVTAFYELEEGIYELTGQWISSEERGESMDAWINTQVTYLLSSVA